jgi:hypothetical protein
MLRRLREEKVGIFMAILLVGGIAALTSFESPRIYDRHEESPTSQKLDVPAIKLDLEKRIIEARNESRFSNFLESDEEAVKLQNDFEEQLKAYDEIEKDYKIESEIYSQLLLEHIDNPNHPDLVRAFEKSDRLLKDLVAVNVQINTLAEKIQNKYKDQLIKEENI